MTQGEGGALRLRPPRRNIDGRARSWWWTQWALALVPLFLTLGVLAWLIEPARPWLLLSLVVVAVVTVPAAVLLPIWWYRVHRWEVTDDAVYALTGWLVREWRVSPISRVQTVDAIQGPLEQLLGLSTLRVTTASSRGAVDIVGLDRRVAADVAERLAAVTQNTAGDAT